MKRIGYKILTLIVMLSISLGSMAQVDSRNRTAETVVADGLAQLPSKTLKRYNQVMSELSGTGEQGVKMLCEMLVPAAKGENAKVEYALSGVVDYVMQPDKEALRSGVRAGLVKSLDACTDNANKAFLFDLLTKVATANEYGVLAKALDDEYLQDHAVNALCTVPGIDEEVKGLVSAGAHPKAKLAYIAYMRKLEGVEGVLLSWLNGADVATRDAVYYALRECGGEQSLKTLSQAAKAVKYQDEPTHVTDSYLTLVTRLNNVKEMQLAGKEMVKSPVNAVRCAGLRMLLAGSADKAPCMAVNALADKNVQYRATALQYIKEQGGENGIALMMQKYPSLPSASKADVLSWLGNNHVVAQVPVVAREVKSASSEVSRAAIEACGRLGGGNALSAVIGALGGQNGELALATLLSFNGDVSGGMIDILNSNDETTLINALSVTGARRLHTAYGKVVALTKSENPAVSKAAIAALKGVVKDSRFGAVAQMLEKAKADEVAGYQAAANAAIAGLSAEKQFELVNAQMKGSKNADLYYPILAQGGSAKAIEVLTKAYESTKSEAAYTSLLKVNKPEVMPMLLKVASENPSKKDEIANRYLQLAKGAGNNVKKYQYYRQVMDLNPSDKVKTAVVKALGATQEPSALAYVVKYMDNGATAFEAAGAVKGIIAKNESLQSGAWAASMLKKAQAIYKQQTDNADAGYAVDEITGMLEKLGKIDYTVKADGEMTEYNGGNQENFELTLDWRQAEGDVVLTVRDMPLVTLSTANGVGFNGAFNKEVLNAVGEWNTLNVKVVNDRMKMVVNGVSVAENAVIVNPEEGASLKSQGALKLSGDGLSVRNVVLMPLASTPVFVLPEDEAREGFEVLFDGRSLEKWQGNTTGYVPVDGNIYVTANYGGSGNLYTKKRYSDFVFRFEFCFAVPGVNNGVGVRTEIGTDAAYEGMEIQILDHDDPIYKGLHDYQQHGGVYGVIVPKHVVFGELGTWNVEEIVVKGDQVKVTVNGDVILDGNVREACQGHNVAPDGSNKNPYTIDHKNHPGLFNKDGYVSFCGHGPGIKIRNVRILDLSKPQTTGKSTKRKKK